MTQATPKASPTLPREARTDTATETCACAAAKRRVAVFDFDGTLTRRDTFPAFISFAFSPMRFYVGLLLFAPLLMLMKLRLYSNERAKERMFSYFFRGMTHREFQDLGHDFATVVEGFRRDDIVARLRQHIAQGDHVYIVSASIDEWVRPWCMALGVSDVLATLAETGNDGRLTGRLKSRNCYGQEKVRRLLEVEPQRSEYTLCAYGDSRGDKEMIDFADEGHYV